ncbi:ras-responsive element-binding protein 1 [Plakobranchus ocellatus]|uniref:Ras-responsive element-binding protein 1 n=1 Tax=Plakobranchus ocellatus TaxID=259542 RepID=A0AAV3YA02_9GAST|nr:ras-responsive element-binding protein 1 [Plakobranchus ocellatus]
MENRLQDPGGNHTVCCTRTRAQGAIKPHQFDPPLEPSSVPLPPLKATVPGSPSANWPSPSYQREYPFDQGSSQHQVKFSGQPIQKPPSLIPPNFLLTSTTPASSSSSPSTSTPLFPSPFLPPPPQLVVNPCVPPVVNPFTAPVPPPPFPTPSSSSLPYQSPMFDDMARRKKSPKSIVPWRMRLPHSNQQDASNVNSSSGLSKGPKCQMCPAVPPDGPPVEGHEYFIDPDGTLTIKNGVCPRNLAFILFSHVSANGSRYEMHLGENLVKFVLNLKQIVDKHRYVCPSETTLQWTTAQNVLKDYAHGSPLKQLSSPSSSSLDSITGSDSNPRKRPHQDTAPRFAQVFTGEEELDGAGEDEPPSGVTAYRVNSMPDNFLVEPLPTPSPSPSHSPAPPGGKSSHSTRKDKRNADSGLALTPSGSERDPRDGASDSGSVGGASSRVTSPAPSVSSVTSNLSLAEAAKQMANTKRGSKILPIASGDGGTRYLCPVCALELPNDHDLTVHIRSHNAQGVSGQMAAPNSCTICGKTLSSQSSLDRHMLVHSGERPFKCKICDMSFTTNGNMHRHSRIHEKNGTSVPKPPGRKPSSQAAAAAAAASASSSSSTSASSTTPSSAASKGGRSKKESGAHRLGGGAFPREVAAPSPAQVPTLMAEFGSDKLDLFKAQPDQSALLQQYYNDMSVRMGPFMFPFGSHHHHHHHPAFPYQHLMSDPGHLPYLPSMLNPITGEVFAKRARLASPSHAHAIWAATAATHGPFAHMAREIAREPSPDLRAQRSHPCNLCPKMFTSQWSLDSHMESHVLVDEKLEAESGCAVCKICKTVAKSEESLLLHSLTHHQETKDIAKPDKTTPRKSPSPKSSPSSFTQRQTFCASSPSMKSSSASSPPGNKGSSSSNINSKTDNSSSSSAGQGFQCLNFASFTTKKFPLIAKAFCEEQAESARGSRLPVFPCGQCELEFPVEGARDLHEVSHLPEEYTSCPLCKCHFSSSTQLQLHMHKHVSDLKFEEIRNLGEVEDKGSPDIGDGLAQGHFLAQFGLVAKDMGALPIPAPKEIPDTVNDKVDNEHENDVHLSKQDEDGMTKTGLGMNEPLVKQEVVAAEEDKEETKIVDDGEEDSLWSDQTSSLLTHSKEGSAFSRPFRPSASLIPTRDKSATERVKGSTSSSSTALKISASLFGGRAVKATASRSPSPARIAESVPRDDPSMPPLFPCKHCGVVLSSPQALKQHQTSQHEAAAQFQCQVCSYTSTDKSTLLRHMRTHSGERPYKCAVCDYSFTTKANCERHLRKKHGLDRDQLAGKIKCNQYIITSSSIEDALTDDAASKADPGISPVPSLTPFSRAGAGDTECPACHVDFFNLRGLQQHLQVSSQCRMGYLCLMCKVTFSSRKALISHMSSQHPSILAQDYNRLTASLETAGDGALGGGASPMLTPPPAHAHCKPKALSPVPPSITNSPSISFVQQQQHPQKMVSSFLTLPSPNGLDKFSHVAPSLSQRVSPDGDDQPLDFSSTGRLREQQELASNKKRQKKKKALTSYTGSSSEENWEEDSEDVVMSPEEAEGPIDLSVSRPPRQQITPGVKAVTFAQGQALRPDQVEELYGVALRVWLAKTLRHP